MWLKNFNRKTSGLYVVIVAVLLLELILVAQLYYTRRMMEGELERHAESELTMKAILVKSMLNVTQHVLSDHQDDMRRHLHQPDTMFRVVHSLVTANPNLNGGWVAFAPGFYPQKGRLFEPYAMRVGNEIKVVQLANESHDYTENVYYKETALKKSFYWTKPYLDTDGTGEKITTCNLPFYNSAGDFQGILGVDLSLRWLGDTLNVRHLYPSSFLMLFTEDGEVISSPPSKHDKYGDADEVAALFSDSTVTRVSSNSGRSEVMEFKSRATGDQAYVYYAVMRGEPRWRIAVVCYDDEVYSKLYKLGYNLLFLNLLAVAIMAFILIRFMRNLRRLSQARLEQELVNNELSVAQKIQNAILPKALSGLENADVAGSITPAKQVGGDLYDFFVRNEKLFFCIGDVSGKGIPSALIMSVTESLFRQAAERESNPAHIMADLNRAICRNNQTNMFVTMLIGVLDLPTGHLRYCNAGHDLPLLLTDTVTTLSADANLPLGVFESTKYEMQETHVAPGTAIFLYTDGLTEAINVVRCQLGLDRVKSAIAASSHKTMEEMLRYMLNAVHEFVGEAEQSDDLTMLAIRYIGGNEASLLFKEDITLPNDVKHVPQLTEFVESVAQKSGCDTATAMQVKLAVEEAVVNCMNYAYPAGHVGNVDVSAGADGKHLVFVITDNGVAFDPTEMARADTSLSAADRPIGGLGILLVRELMDSVNYERTGGKNVLTLKKKLN